MEHFLKLLDISQQQIESLIDLAIAMKNDRKNGIVNNCLQGKTLGMIFSKSSTRTRVSFEVGMYQLGGHALYLNASDLQLNRGECIKDTAKTLSRYVDAIMIRTYEHEDVEEFVKYSSVPIINGLTDFAHPCQVLADLMTIKEYKKSLTGLKLCYIGDGNNMANSLIVGCLKMGMKISIACPDKYLPHADILKFAANFQDSFEITTISDGAKDADILYTDVWASMGKESEVLERNRDFLGYQINKEVVSLAKSDALVLHCLPAHRGEEIADDIMELHTEIFDQAENRLHVQKAILSTLMKK